jgi:hypothetical protein
VACKLNISNIKQNFWVNYKEDKNVPFVRTGFTPPTHQLEVKAMKEGNP